MHDMWAGMASCNFIYGQLFGYLWIFFAVSIVQNIFMVIVEDSYISIKYAKNFEWLQSGEKHDNSAPHDHARRFTGGQGPGDDD